MLRRSCGQRFANPAWFVQLPPVSNPHTIIAGTAGWCGTWSLFRADVNDGLVAVSETMICGSEAPILFPVLHTFLMNDRAVYRLIAERLKEE